MELLYDFELPMRWDDLIFERLEREIGLPVGLPEGRHLDDQTRARMALRGALLDPGDLEGLPE